MVAFRAVLFGTTLAISLAAAVLQGIELPLEHRAVVTAHIEQSETLLQPTTTSSTDTPTVHELVAPLTAHTEETQISLQIATSAAATQTQDQVIVSATSVSATQTQDQVIVSATSNEPVYIPTTSSSPVTDTTLIQTSPAQQQSQTTPDASSPAAVIPSNGQAVYTSAANTTPATAVSPASLQPSQVGTVGIVAGASAVTIGGTTYSLAADASSIYVNGVASTFSQATVTTGSQKQTGLLMLPGYTSNTVWATSGEVTTSSDAVLTVKASMLTSIKSATTATSTYTTTTRVSTIASATAGASTGAAVVPGTSKAWSFALSVALVCIVVI